ncbi:hypothetical protein AAMO2058_001024200 [Amorphochlora amoebiformis]
MNRISKIVEHIRKGNTTSGESHNVKGFVQKPPIRVCLTGAAGNIGYSLGLLIGNGRLLGPDQPIDLRLLEIPQMESKLKGVAMEIRDGAFPLISKLTCTSDPKVAFCDCELALLVGAFPRKKGMLRSELMQRNAAIFKKQGIALNKYADRNVKVVVVGNPANANAMVARAFGKDLNPDNFTALTRLDQNRAVSLLSSRLLCNVSAVRNVIVWGNHSKTMYPDVSRGYVLGPLGNKNSIREAVSDRKWLSSEFLHTVRSRGAAIIKARGSSSAASAANAVCDHVRDWFTGSNEPVSMGVPSDGSYGIPKGLIYSFPCKVSGGFKYEIIKGLQLDQDAEKALQHSANELLEQRKSALEAANNA